MYQLLDREIQMKKNLCNMKTYVIHYTPFVKRKLFMEQQLKKYGIGAEYITDYDKEDLTENDLLKFETKLPYLTLPAISVCCKHIQSWRKVANENLDYALILEDDAIFCDDFDVKSNEYLMELPNDFDMLFIGTCCNLHIRKWELREGQHIYLKSNNPRRGCAGASRCADSYLVSKKCVHAIIKYIDTDSYIVNNTIDHWLNDIMRDLNLKVYWAEPPIVSQGSVSGKFESWTKFL